MNNEYQVISDQSHITIKNQKYLELDSDNKIEYRIRSIEES